MKEAETDEPDGTQPSADEPGSAPDPLVELKTEIAELKEAVAKIALPPSIDAAAGRNSGPPLSKEALARMSPDEIAKLDWNDVRRVLAAG